MERQLELLQSVTRKRENPAKIFAVAIIAAAVTLVLQGSINAYLPGPYFFLFFPVAAGVAWIYGFRASLVTVVLLVVGANYFFLIPKFEFGIGSVGENIALGFAGATSLFSGWIVSKLHTKERVATLAQNELATTLRSIGDAVIVVNRDKRIAYLNPIAETLTGWTVAEARGVEMDRVFDIVNEKTRKPAENPVERVLSEGIIVGLANHTVLIAKDGKERPIEDSAAPIVVSGSNEPVGVVLVFRDVTEKHEAAAKAKVAEDSLGHNQRLLDQIFNEAPAFMVIVSYPDLKFVRANEAYQALVGRKEIVGKKVTEVLPRYEADGLATLVKQVAESRERFVGVEVPITISKPGEESRLEYFDFVYQPLLDSSGQTYAILSQGTSVTEKVKARKIIEESKIAIENERENFRNLFRQTPEMVCILRGPEHVFEFVNEAHVKALGFDATGKPVRVAQPESVEVHGILDDVYRTGKTAELHEIPVTLGSELRYFNLTYAARRDLDGKINGVMILGTEVTNEVLSREKIKRSEAALVTKTAQLETMIEQMPMAVVFADANGKLVFANKQVDKVWRHGFIPSETIEEYKEYVGFHPDGRRFEGKDWPIARALTTGEVVVNEDVDVLRGDGTRGIIRLSAAPVRDPEGKIIGGIVVSDDVTEQKRFEQDLKQAKEEAERANELKSAFLANMSHEIRTPLGAMIGFADLLRDPSLAPGERDNYTEILARNGESLSVIINDILDLSKVEAGQLTLEFAETSPSEIAEDVVLLLRVKAKEKDLAFDFQCEDDMPKTITSDSIRIRQVLLNIVANAVKFTQFGSVKVRCFGCKNDEGRDSVCFEVTDTGIGIPLSQKDKIFEMFVQADGSMTRRFGGTGLGLALSRRLALALGGDIRITETEPGKGSTFLITIQDQPEKKNTTFGPERPQKSVVDLKPNALDGLNVLVVDDSPDNRQLIWHYLSKQGALVETAENGLIGYRQAIAGNYDIVLMDIQMPEMDGYTATHKLREAGFRKPILALTAHAMTDVRQKCLNVGCTGHLPKPIDRQVLISTILEFVGQ